MNFGGSAGQQKWLESLLKAMNEKKYCDTTIIIGSEKKEFNVNRFILAQASPVFDAMFYHCQSNGDLALETVACDVFESALRFCHGGDPQVTEKNVIALIQFAVKYEIDGLLDWGKHCLSACLNDDNFCRLFDEAVIKNQVQSLGICVKFIINKKWGFELIFESASFNLMSIMAIRELIKMSKVRICEQKLWNYLIKWAEHESSEKIDGVMELANDEKCDGSDKKSRLNAVYNFVRFGLMTNEFIATKVVPENVLSNK